MKIKINETVLCFPPYVSTTWDQVKSLRLEKEFLVITLADGYSVKIPDLEQSLLEKIFAGHLKFIEQKLETPTPKKEVTHLDHTMNFPLRFGINGLDGFGGALQHNPNQSNTPPLPAEIINKIASIAKIVGNEDIALLPQPEKNCNCIHCQIARAIHQETPEEEVEEEVTDEDLKFRIWDIAQTGEKLYTLTNPLDSNEHYNVFLGEPIGCTCGQNNCEHIRAVLNS